MHSAARIATLRVAVLAGFGASAAIHADALNPGRKFCPLEEACERAHSSVLGSFLGVPTSAIGLAAFGLLYVVTMFPVEVSRRLSRPAGLGAIGFAFVFIGYQALVLGTFCPLCLIADGAALLSGVTALTWRALPKRRSGGWLPPESSGSRLWWATVAVVVLAVPFAWPRSAEPAWVDVPTSFRPDAASIAFVPPVGRAVPPVATPEAASEPPLPSPIAQATVASPEVGVPEIRAEANEGPRPMASDGPVGAPPFPPPTDTASASMTAPSAAEPAVVPAPEPAAEPPTVMVEYLNAFCPHCRATHERLERVLASLPFPVVRYRVYAWGSNDYPLWARACAHAQMLGLEDRMFGELLLARSPSAAEVEAAARRAGLDPKALVAALNDPTPPARLVHDRQIARSASLRGLPTLDIGRRRLMGEASEVELREALNAAHAAAGGR